MTELVTASWVVPVEPAGAVLEDHGIVIEDGVILALDRSATLRERYPGAAETHLPAHVLIPGLVNAHGHAAMTLLRGYADDLALHDWLENHIWPVENAMMGYDYVYDGTRHAIAEMIMGGTTCGVDTYFFPDASASAYAEAGFRTQVCLPVFMFPNAWARDEEDHVHKGLAVRDAWRNEERLTFAFAPHAPYTVSDDGFRRVAVHAQELDMRIHLHLHETAQEVDDGIRDHGTRPFDRIRALGLLGPSLQAVHMTQVSDCELAALATCNAGVVHCPESNMKLASGTCPVPRLLAAGVNVALGTDGVASNNNLDMFGEMQTASLLAKHATGDPTAVSATTALEMATINGARLLGLDEKIGSLVPGKAADICAVDLGGLGLQPVYHPVSQLVYAAGSDAVTHVWIGGDQKLRNRRLVGIDAVGIRSAVGRWHERIAGYANDGGSA